MSTLLSKHAVMVQGTTSDAGKSIVVAGLCRVLKRRGVSVAPFKPQNMALNSAVTCDVGEIGRAQAVQAQACGLEPHTDMNPVLLKPSSDTGAQVIVHGHAVQQMEAEAYHDYKKVVMPAVLESFARLQQTYKKVLVEGAGSPAEVNLRENDIANMGFAEAVDCPVIIVADIDRGGVFAHLVGTLNVLSSSEQQRVIGFIINRFRGDIGLLQPGLDWLEEKTGKPVLGVIPFLEKFFLDAEDAIRISVKQSKTKITVVVPVFSRISNHTDFDALQWHPDVNLQFIRSGQALPSADLIILPGSKSVRKDLALLKENGWDQAIFRHLRYGGKLMGICGGYQMLGQNIDDPLGIEGCPGQSQGLGLFTFQTELKEYKRLHQVSGHLLLNAHKVPFKGYEIHCGITQGTEKYAALASLADHKNDGVISVDSAIIGTYLHGIFDQPEACNALLQWAGLQQPSQSVDMHHLRDQQLDRLADCFEECLNMEFLS